MHPGRYIINQSITLTSTHTLPVYHLPPQILAFDKGPLVGQAVSYESGAAAWAFGNTTVHLISLMHALACAALRRDPQMENLTEHDSHDSVPPAVSLGGGTEEGGGGGAEGGGGGGGGGGAEEGKGGKGLTRAKGEYRF